MARRLLGVAVVAAAALVAAGCGGSSSSSSDTSPATTWADGVCSAVATWTSSISSIGDSLKAGNLSQDSLTSAANDAKDATKTLTSDLSSLGTPDTATGQKAKEAVDQLSTDLEADVKSVQDAVDGASGISGLVSAIPVITSTLVTAKDQVSSTISDLQSLDAKGELQSAFKQASSCAKYTG